MQGVLRMEDYNYKKTPELVSKTLKVGKSNPHKEKVGDASYPGWGNLGGTGGQGGTVLLGRLEGRSCPFLLRTLSAEGFLKSGKERKNQRTRRKHGERRKNLSVL